MRHFRIVRRQQYIDLKSQAVGHANERCDTDNVTDALRRRNKCSTECLAAHWANLNSMKWTLWNDGVDMAEFGMTRVRIGLFQHAMAHPEANSERFESIEAKLDELRSYLYANRESVRGYAEAYRNGERISTAHVESTVNQLINWRMCKKHQMGWSRAGAQQLLHVKTAIINGRLDRYTGHHSVPENIAA